MDFASHFTNPFSIKNCNPFFISIVNFTTPNSRFCSALRFFSKNPRIVPVTSSVAAAAAASVSSSSSPPSPPCLLLVPLLFSIMSGGAVETASTITPSSLSIVFVVVTPLVAAVFVDIIDDRTLLLFIELLRKFEDRREPDVLTSSIFKSFRIFFPAISILVSLSLT